jgi:ubiquinol-cytochrome c reductase cytochrome c1 subunit
MKTSRLYVLALCAALLPALGSAAGGGGANLDEFEGTDSKRSLQRGARVFLNYCLGCHTADYHRYNRMAKDIGLSDEFVSDNMIFTTDKNGDPTKVGALMVSSMTEDYGEASFGIVPPNLALTARSRGVDWLYTYMRSFYLDESRPFGANNVVLPQVGMPHVLAHLQGWQTAVFEEHDGAQPTFVGFEKITRGELSPAEYDGLIRDLVAFMDYLGDPNRATRHAVGFWVMLFLIIFLVLAVMLKKEYWKDVRH